MEKLPLDIIYSVADIVSEHGSSVLPFLQLRNDWSPVRRFFTKGVDTSKIRMSDRDHFARFIKQLVTANVQVQSLIIRPNKNDGFLETNVFVDLLQEGNEDCLHLLRRVRHITTDSKLISQWKPYFPLDCILDTLHVVIRKRHMHNVDLEGWRARKVVIENKRRLRVEFPEDGLVHPLSDEDMYCNMIYSVPKEAKELVVSGSIELSNLPSNVERVTMDGCILSHKFPASLRELELLNVRMECSGVLNACVGLERLHLENMYGFSRAIPEAMWNKWRTTMKYYADLCSLAYTLPYTQSLASVEEFMFTPGNFDIGRRFHHVRIPQSMCLKKLYVERVKIYQDDLPFLNACSDVVLESCEIPKSMDIPAHTVLL